MKKYLLIGGSGFIGKNLADKLSKEDSVIVADMVFNEMFVGNEKISFRPLNFVETVDFTPYLGGVDTVVHLICTVLPCDGTDNINNEIRENIFPTIDLLESMVRCGVKSILFISSGGTVYGEGKGKKQKESSLTQPICKYGAHKLMIEKYLHLYKIYHGINYKTIRLSNPYGSKLSTNAKQGAVSIIARNIIDNKPITVWGNGHNVRDYIHIHDAVSGIIAVDGYCGNNMVFNIGSGIGHSINEIIEIILKLLPNKNADIVYTPKRDCDVGESIMDISVIKRLTTWQPTIELEEGIKMFISQLVEELNL